MKVQDYRGDSRGVECVNDLFVRLINLIVIFAFGHSDRKRYRRTHRRLYFDRYRALYNYKPQNDDELELKEGDTVYVMEKCDDGWYVGSSQRTGYFGTFPGNYVERL